MTKCSSLILFLWCYYKNIKQTCQLKNSVALYWFHEIIMDHAENLSRIKHGSMPMMILSMTRREVVRYAPCLE